MRALIDKNTVATMSARNYMFSSSIHRERDRLGGFKSGLHTEALFPY